MQSYHSARIERVRELLKTVRHGAIATVNENGSPLGSPLFVSFDDELRCYWASGQATQHSQNIARDPRVFVVLFDSHGNGGGLYIQAAVKVLEGEELAAGLKIVNARRQQLGRKPAERALYQGASPQRLYRADPQNIWVNITEYSAAGQPLREFRHKITKSDLLV